MLKIGAVRPYKKLPQQMQGYTNKNMELLSPSKSNEILRYNRAIFIRKVAFPSFSTFLSSLGVY